MTYTPLTPAALKAELTGDPAGLGYAAAWANGSDGTLAALLNDATQTVNGAPRFSIARPQADAAGALSYITLTDWDALSAGHQTYLLMLASGGSLDMVDPINGGPSVAFQNLLALFPAATQTGQIMRALQNRAASRAEVLFGPGTTVSLDDLAAARRA